EDARTDRAEMRRRSCDRPVRFEPAHDGEPPHVAAFSRCSPRRFGTDGQGDVEAFADLEAEKSLGRDAEHNHRTAHHRERPADDGVVAPEATLPEGVAEHGPAGAAAAVVV